MGSKRILIIGAGPGGIPAGHRLLEAGYADFTIVDRASAEARAVCEEAGRVRPEREVVAG